MSSKTNNKNQANIPTSSTSASGSPYNLRRNQSQLGAVVKRNNTKKNRKNILVSITQSSDQQTRSSTPQNARHLRELTSNDQEQFQEKVDTNSMEHSDNDKEQLEENNDTDATQHADNDQEQFEENSADCDAEHSNDEEQSEDTNADGDAEHSNDEEQSEETNADGDAEHSNDEEQSEETNADGDAEHSNDEEQSEETDADGDAERSNDDDAENSDDEEQSEGSSDTGSMEHSDSEEEGLAFRRHNEREKKKPPSIWCHYDLLQDNIYLCHYCPKVRTCLYEETFVSLNSTNVV